MPKLNLKEVSLKTTATENNNKKIEAVFRGNVVCTAIYNLSPDSITLKWIETKDAFQGKGIASMMLNALCETVLSDKVKLQINVVNEETLNNFYFKWFQQRMDPENNETEQLTEKFNSLIIEEDPPIMIITAEDLLWQPLEDKSFRM